MKRPKSSDWSREIARALFEKSRLQVTTEEELEVLLDQCKANKALARVLPFIECQTPSAKLRLEVAASENNGRLRDVLELLHKTQQVCLDEGVPYAVIKSLDALPDVGHDIDLLVGKNLQLVRRQILKRFGCEVVTLTFCDRLSGKFSTFIEGYASDFELYTRISQLGEEYYSEEDILNRRLWAANTTDGTFVCSNEDKLLITCIHTMHRHGKIRLSDLSIAYEAIRGNIDIELVLQIADSSGIQKALAVFLKTLERASADFLGCEILPREVKAHVDRLLQADKILEKLISSLKLRFPLKIPIPLLVLLYLYKAAADISHSRVKSSIKSAVAPALVVLDRAVPLRLQKAISVRIW